MRPGRPVDSGLKDVWRWLHSISAHVSLLCLHPLPSYAVNQTHTLCRHCNFATLPPPERCIFSLNIDPGDADFRHPTTPSIVNLISALRQLYDRFGPGFMISLVPEGTHMPAGALSYGGQFGSYLAVTFAIRDILSFIDEQYYNTPPLEALDGEIYQSNSVDYHAAMTELLLRGFSVGGNSKQMFPPLAASQVAVGFLAGYTSPTIVSQAMDYIILGKAPAEISYKLREPSGYPHMVGAMLGTIDADRRHNYGFSNLVGPRLHRYVGTSWR